MNTASKRGTASPTSVTHAKWTDFAQSFSGITEQQFSDAGLAKLTPDEFAQLLLAVSAIRGEWAEKSQARQVAYSCGPIPAKDYDKVRLYILVNEKTPSEIASGVRQRLRTLYDTEIVYDPIEADLGVEILGFENELENGHKTGYSSSVTTYDPCKGSLGTNEWTVRMLDNHYIVSAATVSSIVDSIISDIDTNDLEAVRKLHAAIKKSISGK